LKATCGIGAVLCAVIGSQSTLVNVITGITVAGQLIAASARASVSPWAVVAVLGTAACAQVTFVNVVAAKPTRVVVAKITHLTATVIAETALIDIDSTRWPGESGFIAVATEVQQAQIAANPTIQAGIDGTIIVHINIASIPAIEIIAGITQLTRTAQTFVHILVTDRALVACTRTIASKGLDASVRADSRILTDPFYTIIIVVDLTRGSCAPTGVSRLTGTGERKQTIIFANTPSATGLVGTVIIKINGTAVTHTATGIARVASAGVTQHPFVGTSTTFTANGGGAIIGEIWHARG